MAGLKVKRRDIGGASVTDVYLPDVGKDDLERATKALDKFALEYEMLSKRASSIILRHINGESTVVHPIDGHSRQRYLWHT
jgi:hypothetical protein